MNLCWQWQACVIPCTCGCRRGVRGQTPHGACKKRMGAAQTSFEADVAGRAGPPCFHKLAEDERLRILHVNVDVHLRPPRLAREVSFVRANGGGSGRCSTDWVLPWECGSKKGVRWIFSGGGVALKWGRERSYWRHELGGGMENFYSVVRHSKHTYVQRRVQGMQ